LVRLVQLQDATHHMALQPPTLLGAQPSHCHPPNPPNPQTPNPKLTLHNQVKRLREVLAMSADEVTSLEARKAALKLGLEERRAEVELHRCRGGGACTGFSGSWVGGASTAPR